MPPRKQTQKAAEKRELQALRSITITVEASEVNLQRLAAFMLFADHLKPKYTYEDRPLPYEDPNDPRFQKEPELQIDYEVVRRSITKHLQAYVAQHGEERARAVIRSFGGERLALVPQEQLIPLDAALEAALQAKPETAK